MKVRELIDRLLDLPPDEEVGLVTQSYAGYCECCGVSYNYDFEPFRYVEIHDTGRWVVSS